MDADSSLSERPGPALLPRRIAMLFALSGIALALSLLPIVAFTINEFCPCPIPRLCFRPCIRAMAFSRSWVGFGAR